MKRNRAAFIKPATAALVIAGAQFGAIHLRAQTNTNVDIPSLIQRLNELEQEVRTLQATQQARQTAGQPVSALAAPARTNSAPIVTLGSDGLFVRSADSNFVSYIHGYTQVQGRFYTGDNNAANDTFLLRRVRPILEGTVYHDYDYRLMADLASGNGTGSTANNNALLDDAYVNARPLRQLQFQAWQYKSPIGLERLESTSDLQLIETGFATALTPNYDVGFSIHNNLFTNVVAYSVGVFDGASDGGSEDAGNGEGKDAVARLFFQPFLTTHWDYLNKLGFGVAGSVGNHTGTLPSYKTSGQQTFYSYPATVTADGEEFRIDPQFYYYWGPFGVMGEYVLASQKVKSTAAGVPDARLNNRAWQIEGSYFLTGEPNTYKPSSLVRVAPLHPFSLSQGGWGAFELAARLQQLTPDSDAFPTYVTAGSARQATAWAVGVNWYLNRNFKLNVNYETTSFENGSATPGTVTSRDERVVLTQAQIAF